MQASPIFYILILLQIQNVCHPLFLLEVIDVFRFLWLGSHNEIVSYKCVIQTQIVVILIRIPHHPLHSKIVIFHSVLGFRGSGIAGGGFVLLLINATF